MVFVPIIFNLWQTFATKHLQTKKCLRSICLLTEVKRQWAMVNLVPGWVTVSVRDQLWDVSNLEFLSVTRLLEF